MANELKSAPIDVALTREDIDQLLAYVEDHAQGGVKNPLHKRLSEALDTAKLSNDVQPCTLYAWIVEPEPGVFGIPSFVLAPPSPDQPPQALSLICLDDKMLPDLEKHARNLAAVIQKPLTLTAVKNMWKLKTIQPSAIQVAQQMPASPLILPKGRPS